MQQARWKKWAVLWLAAGLWATGGATALATDPEGCLNCHQYRGLSRINEQTQTVELFYVNPNYWDQALGPHAHLKCTDCHLREQVEVFPHKPQTPVDCLRTCHINSPGKVSLRFSHDKLKDMLNASVHTQAVLDQANELLGHPLAPGQAHCLLCHDQPLFNRTEEGVAHGQAPIARCNTCHDAQFPQDTRYFYWHVYARCQPAAVRTWTWRGCAARAIPTPPSAPGSPN